MSTLEELILSAYQNPDDESIVNKIHIMVLNNYFFLPVLKSNGAEPVDKSDNILFIKENNLYFVPFFSKKQYLASWAGDAYDEMDNVLMLGREMIAGIDSQAYLCLDIDQKHYKQFCPDELMKLKKAVNKLDSLALKSV